MKRILLLLSIFTSFFVKAQNIHTNQLTKNQRGDSINLNNVTNYIPDNYDPHVTPWDHRYGFKNLNIWAAKVSDTTGFSGGADTSICSIMLNMHSFGANGTSGYWSPHIVNLLRSTYHMPWGGPGYISGQAIGTPGYTGYLTNGWTLNSFSSSQIGKGPDGNSWIGALNDTISLYPGPSSQDYLTFTNLTIFYYDTTGGGTFTVKVDGTVIGTVNTSSGTTGFATAKFSGLSVSSHRVTLTETVAGSNGVEVMGILCYTSGKRSMILENCSQGGSTIGQFASLNPQMFGAELQALNPTCILADWTINSIKTNVDTAVCTTQLDTIFHRYKAYVPFSDVVYMGPTSYGFARWGTPSEPIAAYTRSILRLCLTDSVSFFDLGQLTGSFQYGITNGTIGGDSLHPTPQLFYVAAGELFNLIGGITADSAVLNPTFFNGNGYLTNQSALGAFRYANFFSVGRGLLFDSLDNFKIRGSTGGDFINISPSTTGTVFFTNSSGSAGHYNFDGIIAGPSFSVGSTGIVAGVSSLSMSFGTSGVPALVLAHTDANFGEYATYLDPNLSTSNGTGYNYMGKTANSINSIFYGYVHKGASSTANAAFWDVGGGTSTNTNMVLNGAGSLGLGLASYTTAVKAGVLLDMESTTLGLLPPVMTLAQFTAITTVSGNHAVLSDSSNKLAVNTGSKIVTYATTDQLGSSGGTNFYTTDGTLTSNRHVLGNTDSLYLGTVASPLSHFQSAATLGWFFRGTTGNTPDFLVGGDGFVRSISLQASLVTQVGGNFAISGWQIATGTVTITNNITNLLVNPTTLAASAIITLPSAPVDGALVKIHFGGTLGSGAPVVTTLTISPNSGQTIEQTAAPTTAVGGTCIIYQYNSNLSIWYREQ